MNKAIDSHGAFPHGIMPPVDLHVHSNRSDGTFSPSQLVDYAIEKGLAAFALTDHDTIDGLEEAIFYAEGLKSKQNKIPSALPADSDAAASNLSSEPDKPASAAEPNNAAFYNSPESDEATSSTITKPDSGTALGNPAKTV